MARVSLRPGDVSYTTDLVEPRRMTRQERRDARALFEKMAAQREGNSTAAPEYSDGAAIGLLAKTLARLLAEDDKYRGEIYPQPQMTRPPRL